MTNNLDDLLKISQLLDLGKIILCPTDTIWGLSCDANNAEAVDKIYQIKRRDRSKPLILLVSDLAMLHRYTSNIHPRVENLIDLYKRPLTIIHQASDLLPCHIKNQNGSIAIRVTSDESLKELITHLGRPIVSTSANIQGTPSPDNFVSISEDIKIGADYIFQSRRQQASMVSESTLISYNEEGELFFLR